MTTSVVKQRLRLGAVSPKLLQVYREDGLTLDQLMAFAITEDHARQEQVLEGLHHNREPWIIRRDMTAANVPAHDRRAIFVGAKAYQEADGTIIRDLFSEDRGGFFEDVGLLDMLTVEKLREIADEVQAEGWKWAEAHIDYPHAHGMRRFYPEPVELTEADEARLRKPPLTEHDMWGITPIDQMICRIQFREADYRGPFTPPSVGRYSVEYPGYNGGSDWGGVSVDARRGVIVANYNDMPNYVRLITREMTDKLGIKPRFALPPDASLTNAHSVDPQWGSPYAIQVNAGWRMKLTGLLCKRPPYGGIRAIDLRARPSGPTRFRRAVRRRRWSMNRAAGNISRSSLGEHHFMQTKMGDSVIAFALPRTRS